MQLTSAIFCIILFLSSSVADIARMVLSNNDVNFTPFIAPYRVFTFRMTGDTLRYKRNVPDIFYHILLQCYTKPIVISIFQQLPFYKCLFVLSWLVFDGYIFDYRVFMNHILTFIFSTLYTSHFIILEEVLLCQENQELYLNQTFITL